MRSDTFTMRRISHKHAGLACCGIALVALAASLPTLVELNIKENVRASVVVDTYKAWHKKRGPVWKAPRHRADAATEARRIDSVGRPKFDFHTGTSASAVRPPSTRGTSLI